MERRERDVRRTGIRRALRRDVRARRRQTEERPRAAVDRSSASTAGTRERVPARRRAMHLRDERRRRRAAGGVADRGGILQTRRDAETPGRRREERPEAIRRAAKGDAEEDPIRIVEKGRERLSLALALAPTTSPAPASPPGRSSPPDVRLRRRPRVRRVGDASARPKPPVNNASVSVVVPASVSARARVFVRRVRSGTRVGGAREGGGVRGGGGEGKSKGK